MSAQPLSALVYARSEERACFAIWSRERGFLGDKIDKEKVILEMKAARIRQTKSDAQVPASKRLLDCQMFDYSDESD